ncbi:hypothetical protein D3C71_1361820 [compost metagenome]
MASSLSGCQATRSSTSAALPGRKSEKRMASATVAATAQDKAVRQPQRHNVASNSPMMMNAVNVSVGFGPICTASRLLSHSAEASIISPRITRTTFIQRPGRGMCNASPGQAAINSHGKLMPTPITRKIPHSSGKGATSATETAVPRNGAVQGVASSVAKAP